MAREVRMPQWGMGMQEGTVARWLKQEDDPVEKGEVLAEVEAAKVTEVVEAPTSGVLERILVTEGETVPVRTVLCTIAVKESIVEKTPAADETQEPQTPAQAARSVQVTPVARRLAREHDIDLDSIEGTGAGGRITEEDVRRSIEADTQVPSAPAVQVEPRARRLAQEHEIALAQIQGTGPSGRITEDDVRAALEAAPEPAGERIPLTGVRGTIARRMYNSLQSTAQLTITAEADVTELVAQREALKQQFDLTYTDLIVKAAALTLRDHPRLNAWLIEDEIQLKTDIDVGIAVALEDGLIVPVIRHADEKPVEKIAQETRHLAEQARSGDLASEDVSDSTFSVTNLGMYGIDAFTPILNPPEVAILGVGRITETPARSDDGGIAWRQTLTLSLTFDHRAVDGAPAALFLDDLRSRLEAPDWLEA